MEEFVENEILIDKLEQLNELEIKKSKVLAVIFQKRTNKIVERKVENLQIDIQEQAEFYNQKLEDYQDICQELITRYKEQISQIVQQYNELYKNMYLELQEAECNQKIAITNLKKSYQNKKKIESKAGIELIEEYNRKINACMQKKINYDTIINECETELESCAMNMEKKINSLFNDKSGHISLKEENAFGKFINQIKNMFRGKAKFNNYVIEPINIELEMMDNKLPDALSSIKQEMITFVAKIRQSKNETNAIFNEMMGE